MDNDNNLEELEDENLDRGAGRPSGSTTKRRKYTTKKSLTMLVSDVLNQLKNNDVDMDETRAKSIFKGVDTQRSLLEKEVKTDEVPRAELESFEAILKRTPVENRKALIIEYTKSLEQKLKEHDEKSKVKKEVLVTT